MGSLCHNHGRSSHHSATLDLNPVRALPTVTSLRFDPCNPWVRVLQLAALASGSICTPEDGSVIYPNLVNELSNQLREVDRNGGVSL